MITLWVDFDVSYDRTIMLAFSSDKELQEHEKQAIALMNKYIKTTVLPGHTNRIFDQRCKIGIMARLNYLSMEILIQTNVKIDVREVLPKHCTCVCTCGAL